MKLIVVRDVDRQKEPALNAEPWELFLSGGSRESLNRGSPCSRGRALAYDVRPMVTRPLFGIRSKLKISIAHLAKKYKVSPQAMTLRLINRSQWIGSEK